MAAIDRIDERILAVLSQEGRLSNQDLAGRIGLSASACLRRVRRLEEAGLIRGYTAVLDGDALGFGRSVYVEISLESQRSDLLDAFEAAVRTCPGVLSCHLMAGQADYLLRVAVAGVDDYERIHRTHLAALPGVASIRSAFTLRAVVDRRVPVERFS